jgi:hypothetical protein
MAPDAPPKLSGTRSAVRRAPWNDESGLLDADRVMGAITLSLFIEEVVP